MPLIGTRNSKLWERLFTEDLEIVLKEEEKHCKTVKRLYGCLLESNVKRGESFISSRAEKKNTGIKFGNVWKNQVLISKVRPELRYFTWSLGQDSGSEKE